MVFLINKEREKMNDYTTVIKKIKSLITVIEPITLDIKVPEMLFYFSEKLDNGYEKNLENKIITIDIKGSDYRDKQSLRFRIKENFSKENLLKLSNDSEIPDYEYFKNLSVELNYQVARKATLDLISFIEPHSVNLITK